MPLDPVAVAHAAHRSPSANPIARVRAVAQTDAAAVAAVVRAARHAMEVHAFASPTARAKAVAPTDVAAAVEVVAAEPTVTVVAACVPRRHAPSGGPAQQSIGRPMEALAPILDLQAQDRLLAAVQSLLE